MRGFEKMDWLDRWWRRLLVGLLPLGLVLAACTGATGVSNNGSAVPQGERTMAVDLDKFRETASEAPVGYLTINVAMTDDGLQPATIFTPVGRRVQLIVRNRGSTEHHFRVLGLVPDDLLWLAREETDEEADRLASGEVTEAEHDAHHPSAGFAPYRSTSPAGITPQGDEVHAYAEVGGMDVVLFTATKAGTFSVRCPRHPGIVGSVVAF